MDWKKIIRQLENDPFRSCAYLIGKLLYYRLILKRNITMGKGVKIIGMPIIDIRGNCSIHIGNNVLLNSRNKGYFGALYNPVKLFVDNEKAFIKIGNNTRIHGACIHAYNSIEIGNNCLIAANTIIVDSNGHEIFPAEINKRLATKKEGLPVVIEDNVWIGLNSIILKGVKIGEGAIIGAGSIVRDNVPSYSVVIGNPAKVVKRLNK